jgi:hypothetical protein
VGATEARPVKARSTIVELADTAIPIFGDSERDYDYFTALKGYDAIEGGIEAEVESFEGRTASLRVRFVAPEIVRVQYALERPVEPPASTPMLVEPLPAPPDVRLDEGEDAVSLSSPSLRLMVERQPLRWSLVDGNGAAVAAQESHDGSLDPAGRSGRARHLPSTSRLRFGLTSSSLAWASLSAPLTGVAPA